MKRILALLLVLLASPASAQTLTTGNFWHFITSSPDATNPLSTDFVPLIRGGQTFRTPASTVVPIGGAMARNAANAVMPDARFNLGAAAGDGASINPVTDGYHAVCNGVANDTNAINNAIAALMPFGGTLVLPGLCRMNGPLIIPYTGAAPPVQKPLRITSKGTSWDGSLVGGDAPGGGGLDLRYDCTGAQVAKIDTRGVGMLEIDHLIIKSGGTDNCLMFQTTNTTVNIHDNHFIGNPSRGGTTALQNAIQFGGITDASANLGTASATDGYQGYGSQVVNNLFSRFNHVFNFGGAANGIYIANNTVDLTCGSSEVNGAPYVFYGAGLGASGNVVSGGIVEMHNYPWGVAFLTTTAVTGVVKLNTLMGLGLYDENMGAPTLGAYYFQTTNLSVLNTILDGFVDVPLLDAPAMGGPGADFNTHINGSRPSVFQGGLSLGANFGVAGSLETISTGQIRGVAITGTGLSVRQQSATLYDPRIGDNTGLQYGSVLGGGSGAGNGAAIKFGYGGVLGNQIGGYSTITGGAYNPDLTLFDASGNIHLFAHNSYTALNTDSTGKIGSAPTIGTGDLVVGSDVAAWTPSDQSGAGLTLTTADAFWVRNGKSCTVSATVTYPVTADGSVAVVGGFPCVGHNGTNNISIGTTTAGPGLYDVIIMNNTSNVQFYDDTAVATKTNVSLSGKTISFTVTYLTN